MTARELFMGGKLSPEGHIKVTVWTDAAGKIVSCPTKDLLKAGGLLGDQTWANWDDTRLKELVSVDQPVRTVSEVAFEWLCDPKRWLIFYGGYGTGKTHLAKVLARHWVFKHEKAAMFVNWASWLETKRDSFTSEKGVIGQAMRELADVPFLVLDDISTGRTTTTLWALDQLYVLLEGRMDKLTIITTNISKGSASVADNYAAVLLGKKKVAAANGDPLTYKDLVGKVADRLRSGEEHGNVFKEIPFRTRKHGGSARAS